MDKGSFLTEVVYASLASHTPVNAFMDMTVTRFYDFTAAIGKALEQTRTKAH